jgi:hypothetical protein
MMCDENKYRGEIIIPIVIILFTCCLTGAFLAKKYLPKEEAVLVEDELQDIAEHEAEDLFHLPDGSLKEEMGIIFPDEN